MVKLRGPGVGQRPEGSAERLRVSGSNISVAYRTEQRKNEGAAGNDLPPPPSHGRYLMRRYRRRVPEGKAGWLLSALDLNGASSKEGTISALGGGGTGSVPAAAQRSALSQIL